MNAILLIGNISETVEELICRADLRECDLRIVDGISSESRKKEWLKSRVMVWERFGKHIDTAMNGAPLLDGGYVSISHTEGCVAVICSDQPCGIDIEKKDRNAARLVRKFATSDEIETVRNVYSDNPELLVWCAKEAIYKYAGREGAEFLTDFVITGAVGKRLTANVFGSEIALRFVEMEDILVAMCPDGEIIIEHL